MRASEFSNSKLVIFDIDDTLVNTDTKVNVVKAGKVVKQLNSHDFTHYHLQPGEEFDFGAFKDAREFYTQAKPIPGMIRQLKQDIATGNKVIMLTARSDFNDREVFLDTFRQYGIDMSKVHVYRAGNLNIKAATEEKKKIILQHLLGKEHYDKIIMYDDSVPNLNAFLSLKQDYPWSKFYAWHVDPSGQADEYHRTDIKITEVNAPGELSVDEDLVKKFTDRGYQMDGEGSDQLVLSRPGSRMVLKIVGAGSEPRKNIIRRYVNFFRQHQRNPHFPRVGPDKELRWEGQRYYMYSQERLHDFEGGDDGEIRDYLEQLLALSWVRHTMKDQPPDLGELPPGLSEDQVKGLLAAVTLLYQSGIAGQYGYDLGNSYNIMQRASDNTLVIVDPFSDPEVEDLDETVTEAREGVMEILRRELPDWPDYVIKDWIYQKIQSPIDLEGKLNHVREIAKMVQPNSWRLHRKMPITFDMLSNKTRYFMKTKRQFGERNPFMVARDRERLEDAIRLVREKGMENLPPVIMLQHPDGLELVEGWHRMMAAFRQHPEGFRVNAWIGQS